MSDEAKRIAHQIAADLLDPDDLTGIIGNYAVVTDELFPAVRNALLELRQELLEDIDEDVMTPEEEAEIDAILDKYRGADGKLDYDLLDKNSGPLPADLQAGFNAVAHAGASEEPDDEELSDEEIAFASIRNYLDANGQIDFAKMRDEAVTLKAEEYPELAATFPEMFPQETDNGENLPRYEF